MDNAIYIVFSATPTHMGQMIRLATGHRYNHVSLSLEGDLRQMYSFARYHRAIPLYGGFVVESILRYRSFSDAARIKVCRVPIEASALAALRSCLDRLWRDRDAYIYNTPAALASLVHQPTPIPKAYTCVSFLHEILVRYTLIGASALRCPTLWEMEALLAPFTVYEGGVPSASPMEAWGRDSFPCETTARYAFYTTARHFGRLARRLVTGAA